MKKLLTLMLFTAVLSACSSTGSGSSEMYGEAKGGVETSVEK